MLPFEAKLFNVLLLSNSLEFSLKHASAPQEWSCQSNQEPRCSVSIATAQNIYFLPTYWRQFLRVIQTRVWSQAACEIQPPLFPGGGLWTGYTSLSVLASDLWKWGVQRTSLSRFVVKFNEKTGLADRNWALYVSSIIIVGDDAIVLIWGQWAQKKICANRFLPMNPSSWAAATASSAGCFVPFLAPNNCGHQSIPVCEMSQGKVALRGRVITEKCYH